MTVSFKYQNRLRLKKSVSLLLRISVFLAILAVFRLPVSAADPDYTFSSGAVLPDASYNGKNILIQNGVFSVTISGATDEIGRAHV